MTLDRKHMKPHILESLTVLSKDNSPPELGVHVMSEFLFCPRAGIIAYETRQGDTGADFEAAPALGGIPMFEIDQIERDLEVRSRELKQLSIAVGGFVGGAGLVYVYQPALTIWLLVSLIFILLATYSWWRPAITSWFQLRARLAQSRLAKPNEPNWEHKLQQEIEWWELIAAGFQSIKLNRPMHSHEIGLTGKPWRILHRGELRIPVLRIHVDETDGSMGQFRPRLQQQARLAAYAFLTETCERGNADWAIVMFNYGDRGLAFPLDDAEWEAFQTGLPRARSEFQRYENAAQYRPRPTDQGRVCRGCPFGKPRRVGLRPTVLNGVEVLPRITTDNLNREFHCTCHDRFGDEVPPHKLARQLGLTD
ncbi:MAG: hypothetical protein R3C59_21710 [Planctomycetaceae bacterium]